MHLHLQGKGKIRWLHRRKPALRILRTDDLKMKMKAKPMRKAQHLSQLRYLIGAISATWQARWRGLPNVMKQCEFKYLKEVTVNWLPYLMSQVMFNTSKTLQFCWNDCSVWAKVNVKEQLSPLSEFTSFWRHENAQSGVVYRTRTVLRLPLRLQNIHSLCFARIVILFRRPRCRSCRIVDLIGP